jgi:hypothetical protein
LTRYYSSLTSFAAKALSGTRSKSIRSWRTEIYWRSYLDGSLTNWSSCRTIQSIHKKKWANSPPHSW